MELAAGRKLDQQLMVEVVRRLRKERDESNAIQGIAILIAEAPRVSEAQADMDDHRGGYRNHKARLYELIDFNDVFVETILALPSYELTDFEQQLKKAMSDMCDEVYAFMLSDKQYEAITHGLSREIAVYKAAKELGYDVRMTSRVEDAHGVDMIIRDARGRSMSIDCKTRSSYHFRLLDIKKDGFISEQERLDAELQGFIVLTRGKHSDFVRTTLFRVSTEDLGEIRAFSFVDSTKFADLLKRAMDAQLRKD